MQVESYGGSSIPQNVSLGQSEEGTKSVAVHVTWASVVPVTHVKKRRVAARIVSIKKWTFAMSVNEMG